MEIKRTNILLNEIRNIQNDTIKLLDDSNFIFPKNACELYKKIRLGKKFFSQQNHTDIMSLAYSILVYNDVEQFERLLTSMYEPTNIYCIHVDAKSSEILKKAVKSIADCYDNVFLSTMSENIVYAGFSRLKADINCMNDLLNLSNLIKTHENLKEKREINWRWS